MALASVTVEGRGATDRLLAGVVATLAGEGIRAVGVLREARYATAECESALRLLPDGPAIRITQDLGTGSGACRLDAGALEEAAGLAEARLAAGDGTLLVVNKFGLSEAEGRGFRALIAGALGCGLPVLLGLPDVHRGAFERFAGGMATSLLPDEAAVLAWCRDAAALRLRDGARDGPAPRRPPGSRMIRGAGSAPSAGRRKTGEGRRQ